MSNNSSVGKLVTGHLQPSIDGDHDTQKLFKTKVLFISCEFVNLCHSVGGEARSSVFESFFSCHVRRRRKEAVSQVCESCICLFANSPRTLCEKQQAAQPWNNTLSVSRRLKLISEVGRMLSVLYT